MDKKLLKYVFIIVGLIFLIIFMVVIKNLFSGPKKLTYNDLEEKMISATKQYTKKYPGALPTLEGTSVVIPANVLIENGYLNELSSYVKEEVVCSGSVEIYKSTFGEFDYSPTVNCGAKYETKRLSDKIIFDNDGDGVLSGMGLYKKVNDKFITTNVPQPSSNAKVEYYFRGDVVKNYLKIGDNMWRIVGIDEDYNTILIYEKGFRRGFQWDDRYNEETKKNHGINIYEENGINSRIYEQLQKFYDKDADLQDKEKLSPVVKNIVVPMDICMGSRTTTDETTNGSTECKKVLEYQNISLLPAYLFMNASLDENCKVITDRSCGNYNFFASFSDYWWLLTANAENTNEAYLVQRRYVEPAMCQAKNTVRPMVKISSRVLYSEGDGSLSNPYTIKHFG